MGSVVLGISAYYHDSAAAVILDGNLVAAAQEERFTRKRHDAGFPAHAIKYCLRESGAGISELQGVVFYDKPFAKFDRLLETYLTYAPKGLNSFVAAMPVWLKEKLFLKRTIRAELTRLGDCRMVDLPPLLFRSTIRRTRHRRSIPVRSIVRRSFAWMASANGRQPPAGWRR